MLEEKITDEDSWVETFKIKVYIFNIKKNCANW